MFNFDFFKQKSPQQRFLFILGLFMFLIYLALGIVLIFFRQMFPGLKGSYPTSFGFAIDLRLAFGILLIVYSAFRFGRVLRRGNDDEV